MAYSIKSIPGKTFLVALDPDKEEATATGLVVTLNNDKTPFVTGKVLRVGLGLDFDDPDKSFDDKLGDEECVVLVGARGLFPRHHGTMLEKVDGVEHRLIPMSSLVAVLDD